MFGWILLVLTWMMITVVSITETPSTEVSKPEPLEEKFVIKTFEKTVCKDDTDETYVWRTVESVKID